MHACMHDYMFVHEPHCILTTKCLYSVCEPSLSAYAWHQVSVVAGRWFRAFADSGFVPTGQKHRLCGQQQLLFMLHNIT